MEAVTFYHFYALIISSGRKLSLKFLVCSTYKLRCNYYSFDNKSSNYKGNKLFEIECADRFALFTLNYFWGNYNIIISLPSYSFGLNSLTSNVSKSKQSLKFSSSLTEAGSCRLQFSLVKRVDKKSMTRLNNRFVLSRRNPWFKGN